VASEAEVRMLHAEVADAATVGGIVIPIIVTLLTIAGAVVAPRLTSNADDLKHAENLSVVLNTMVPSPERELVERERDDLATVWTLRQAAPVFTTMRATGTAAYVGGVAVLLLGVLYLLVTPGYQWWFWLVYLLGVALLVTGWLLLRTRAARRRTWMSRELRRRGLRLPTDARLLREVAGSVERRMRAGPAVPPQHITSNPPGDNAAE
jgi:hypothetical protein